MPSCCQNHPEFKRRRACSLSAVAIYIGLSLVCLSVHAQASQDEVAIPGVDAKALSRAEVLGLYFTPPANAAAAVVDVIDQSQTQVLVQAYGFTHNGIAQALIRAQARGVQVRVLLDQKSETSNRYVIELMVANDMVWRQDGQHAIAHNKVIVVDNNIVITGSFNFTNSAQTRNAENLLVLKSSELAQSYKTNWELHWAHSR
mgnify:CR=1 FL=1